MRLPGRTDETSNGWVKHTPNLPRWNKANRPIEAGVVETNESHAKRQQFGNVQMKTELYPICQRLLRPAG